MQPAGIDVKLVRSTIVPGVFDLQLDAAGDIATEDSFDTAISVSLFTDARASETQVVLPELRRGWVGNERTPGFQMGGHLWLFQMPRLNQVTANALKDAARGALRWLVEDGFALQIRTEIFLIDSERARLEILITKPNGETETKQFNLWSNSGRTFGEPV